MNCAMSIIAPATPLSRHVKGLERSLPVFGGVAMQAVARRLHLFGSTGLVSVGLFQVVDALS